MLSQVLRLACLLRSGVPPDDLMALPLSALPLLFQLAATTPDPARGAADVAGPPTPARVLRLADAEAIALKNQPAIHQAHAQREAADARTDIARAPGLPQLTGVLSYQRVRGRGGLTTATGVGGAGVGGTGTGIGASGTTGGAPSAFSTSTDPSGVNVFTFGASASQIIWDFGQVYNRTRAAARLAGALEANEKVAAQSVLVDVRRTYFAVRAQKELVGVADVSLANLQRHLDQIQGFVRVGTRPEIDLAQARTDLANGRLVAIDARNAYAIAQAQLARAVGSTDETRFDVTDDEIGAIDGEDMPPEPLVQRALKQRPETLMIGRQVDSAELSARATRGAYGPTVTAIGGASETGTALADLGPAWNVGAVLSWPLVQGGLTHAQIREFEANASASRAQLETTKLQIRLDVQAAQLGIVAAKAARTAADEVVVNARERLRLAEGRYASGVGSVIELGDAQLALTNASAQVVQARFRLASARADLLSAVGQR